MIYQDEQEIQERQPENSSFATIAQIYEDGVTLLFSGQDTPSQKRYRVNSFAVFHQGDKVFLAKDSGTYVVLFPVGMPKANFRADWSDWSDWSKNAEKATNANKANSATNANHAANADNASKAETAEKADKLTTGRTIKLTGDVTASGTFDGSANLSMAATGVKANAVKDQNSVSNRTIQFRVADFGKLQFKSSYYNSTIWYNMDGTRA